MSVEMKPAAIIIRESVSKNAGRINTNLVAKVLQKISFDGWPHLILCNMNHCFPALLDVQGDFGVVRAQTPASHHFRAHLSCWFHPVASSFKFWHNDADSVLLLTRQVQYGRVDE